MSGAISCTYSLQELAPRSMDDLWERVQDIWATLQENYLHDVYQSLPRRMREVVRNWGRYTKNWSAMASLTSRLILISTQLNNNAISEIRWNWCHFQNGCGFDKGIKNGHKNDKKAEICGMNAMVGMRISKIKSNSQKNDRLCWVPYFIARQERKISDCKAGDLNVWGQDKNEKGTREEQEM